LGGGSLGELALGDLNGDGKLDIVASGDGHSAVGALEHYVVALTNQGNGAFGTPAKWKYYPVGFAISAVRLADTNNDGKLDVVVGDYQPIERGDFPAAVGIFPGNGDGTLGKEIFQPLPESVAKNPGDVFPADLNGDG